MLFWKIRYQTSFFLFAVVLVWIFVFNLIGPHSRTLPGEVWETGMGLCRQLCSVTQSLVPCLKEDVCIPLSVWWQLLFSDSLYAGCCRLQQQWGHLSLGPSDVRVRGSSDSRSHALTELCLLCSCVSYFFFLYQNPRSHRNRHKAEKQYSLTSQCLLVHSEDL